VELAQKGLLNLGLPGAVSLPSEHTRLYAPTNLGEVGLMYFRKGLIRKVLGI
jgi:hypothetical protein